MPHITVLDQNTINKIAAGEVIERPASVVKELLENAIDAKATAVTVEIREGGISFIRVTDNGCGIPKEEVATAFLRHSTSKISSVEDLFTISSLGFRGEALSSIAAVAQVEVITKTSQGLTGVRYQIEGGAEKSLEEVGAPEGTTFIARNLFYNTPVRRKFLKTAQTEGAHVADLVYPEQPEQAPHLRKPQPKGHHLHRLRPGDRRQPAAHPGGGRAGESKGVHRQAGDRPQQPEL